MEWTWGFVTTVVQDVDAASAFYGDVLGLPELGAGEFDSIGAQGRLFGLGNASVAVVSPVADGPARRLLETHRGGLCHIGLRVDEAPPEGESIPLAGDLAIEMVRNGTDRPERRAASPVVAELDHVAVVVGDLEATAARLRELGFADDPRASHWEFPQLQTRNVVFPSRSGYLEINQAFSSEGVFGSLAAARGAGIVGLTLTVTDMDATLDRLRGAGVNVSDPGPVRARTPEGEDRDLGLSAVVSMKHSFGARLFLFAPSPSAPHYG